MEGLSWFRRHALRGVAVAVVLLLYGWARIPNLSEAERREVARPFRFVSSVLPTLPEYAPRFIRQVHPDMQRISAWISAVGASVALNDLDGDSLPNDLCHVDTRIDQVIVAPAPGTGARYPPFALNPSPLPYDPSTMAPMGCLPGDLNEDGLIDLVVYYWGRTPIAFLRPASTENAPLAAHSYRPVEVMPDEAKTATGGRWFTNAATFADLDGDGHLDLILGNYFQDGSRILDARATGHERMQDSMSLSFNGGRNPILRWVAATRGDAPTVRFEEVTDVLDRDASHAWTLAISAADLDGDLLPEIYYANDFGPDHLLHNRSTPGHIRLAPLAGEKTLTVPNSKVLGRGSFKGMGVDFADLNGDGWLDFYVSNIADEYALEESHLLFLSTGKVDQMRVGIAPYIDLSESWGLSRSGWGWDTKFGDFNNDGVPEVVQTTGFVKGTVDRWPELQELAMGNDAMLKHLSMWPRLQPGDDLSGDSHNPFFARASNGRYEDVASEVGVGSPQMGRGIATADVDGDGRLDFAVANQWQDSFFHQNAHEDTEAFLGLRLLLPVAGEAVSAMTVYPGRPAQTVVRGRPAVGAVARVTLPDGRRLVAEVDGGGGHSGRRSPELHFGLGVLPSGAQNPLSVEIAWRDGTGHIHREKMQMAPGWHTVLLGQTPHLGSVASAR